METRYRSDVLTWDYKKIDTPDFIWASPPCATFSHLRNPPARNRFTGVAIIPAGTHGDNILNKTIEIIKYFQKKNPRLRFVIENPRAMMRKQPIMKQFKLHTTSYNRYGDKRYKPTDFWSNFDLYLDPPKKPQKTQLIKKLPLRDRYKIPPKLVRHILLIYILNIIKDEKRLAP